MTIMPVIIRAPSHWQRVPTRSPQRPFSWSPAITGMMRRREVTRDCDRALPFTRPPATSGCQCQWLLLAVLVLAAAKVPVDRP